jgi:hypothetical protein
MRVGTECRRPVMWYMKGLILKNRLEDVESGAKTKKMLAENQISIIQEVLYTGMR